MRRVLVLFLVFGAISILRAQNKPYIEQQELFETVQTTILDAVSVPAKNVIAFADAANKIRLITVNPFAELSTQVQLPAKPTSLSSSPSGENLFVGLENGSVVSVGLSTGSIGKSFAPSKNAVNIVKSVDDNWILTTKNDNQLSVINVVDGASQEIPAFGSTVTAVAFHPSKKFFVVGTQSGMIYSVAVGQMKVERTLSQFTTPVTVLMFSADGSTLVAGSTNGQIAAWETETFSLIASAASSQGAAVRTFTIDPALRWLLSANAENSIDIFDLKTLKFLRQFICSKGQLVTLSFLGNDSFVSVSANGTMTRWRILPTPPDTVAPTIVFDYPVHTSEETAAKFYGSRYILSGVVYDDNEVKTVLLNGTPIQLLPLTGDKTVIPEGMKAKRFTVTLQPDSFGISRYDVECKDEGEHTTQQSFYVNRLSKEQAVDILTPAPNVETDLISIPLRFKAWFDIGTYSISVNMADIVSNQEPGFDVVDNEVTETIPLLMGYNQVQLSLRSKSGENFTYSFGVTRKAGFSTPIASGEKKPRSAGSGPQRWAVVVGVSEYQNSGIPSLKYADKDAESFANFLRRPQGGGFDSDHMRVLLNKDATLANIKDALINFLSQAIDMDLVIIYFAGHGAPEPGRPQNMYLLTHDSNPTALGTTAFPMWDIQTVLARYITAKRVIVFTDACHSGGISVEFATRGLGVTETNLVNQYLADLSKSKEGVVVFTASAAGEVSQEFPEFGHGVFTYFLLQGMEGKADYNNDYTITINELMQYVEEQVKRKTRGAQNPTRSQTQYDKDMTIAIIPH